MFAARQRAARGRVLLVADGARREVNEARLSSVARRHQDEAVYIQEVFVKAQEVGAMFHCLRRDPHIVLWDRSTLASQ